MEYVDVVDNTGLPTGQRVERTVAHAKGIRHRTAHIWVARQTPDGAEILLQKRAACKDSFPGCWDTSSAGHIRAGDEPMASALREIEEELGLRLKPEELTFLGTFERKFDKLFHGRMFHDNEYSFVYLCRKDVSLDRLTYQVEEVERAEWFPLNEVQRLCAEGDRCFCVSSKSLMLVWDYFNK